MLSAGRVTNVELHVDARPSANKRRGAGTLRPSRPSQTRLVSWRAIRGGAVKVDLVGRACGERFVWTLSVVPAAPKRQFAHELGSPERDEHQPSSASPLECPHQPVDDGDASALSDGPEAMANPATPAPAFEPAGCELQASVGDEMSWRPTCSTNGTVEECLDASRGGFFLERG